MQGFISHCPYQKDHGRRLAWILYWGCRGQKEVLIRSLWWWAGFLRWHISFHARRLAMRLTSQICFQGGHSTTWITKKYSFGQGHEIHKKFLEDAMEESRN
jgi:hypothetical protein